MLTTVYGYDPAGNLVSVTDPLGHITSYGYDARNRLTTETQPSGGGTTTYAYDAASRPSSLTDPAGNVTSYGYDAANRVTTETDPRGKVTTYAYDVVGNLTQKTDRDGRVTQYGYDADNRPTTETWVGSSPAETIITAYDAAGRLIGAGDAHSQYTYTYDAANRPTTVDDQGTPGLPRVVLTSSYDNAGNRTSLSDGKGGLTSSTYDVRDELTGLSQSGTGVAPKLVNFAYDPAGNLTALTRYSDLAGTTTVLASAYSYDMANRLTTLTHETALWGGATVASYAYTLDAANRLTSESRTWAGGASNDTLGYAYTDNGQLTGVTHSNSSFSGENFSYDTNGNRNTTGYSTGTGNRLTTDGAFNYGYDDEGNLTSKTAISTGAQTLYQWDYRNRLTEVDSVVRGQTTPLATFTYDVLDRRVGVSEAGSTTWTLYDGTSPLLDFNGSGVQTARYLNGPSAAGVDAVLARETSSGVAWYLSARLGTVRDLVDNTGAVIDHVEYGVYGAVTGETNPSAGDRFKYAGMQYDATTQQYFDQARWYDPASGRFISIDPSGFGAGDVNLDRYVANNSTNFTDPTGLLVPLVGTGAVAIGTGAAAVGIGTVVVGIGVGVATGVGIDYVTNPIVRPWFDGPANWWWNNGPYSPPLPRPTNGPRPGPKPLPQPTSSSGPGPIRRPPVPQPGCLPCDPPVGTVGYRICTNTPHYPFDGPHTHLYIMSQSPNPACKCFWNKGSIIGGTIPPPGTVPIGPAGGGGPIGPAGGIP